MQVQLPNDKKKQPILQAGTSLKSREGYEATIHMAVDLYTITVHGIVILHNIFFTFAYLLRTLCLTFELSQGIIS